MQWLASICIRRPVLATVLMLVLVVVGAFSYLKLGVDRFPKIDFPVVTITTVVPGASPEEIEQDVTDKIESAVNTVAGIDELRSMSSEGVSLVIVQFVLEKNVDVVAQEVRERISTVLRELPPGTETPVVMKMDPDATPILTLALSADASERAVTEFADKVLRRELESVNGVGQVTLIGARPRQVNIWADPRALQKYGLTGTDLERAMRMQNIEVPSGKVEQGARALSVRTRGRVQSIDEMADIVVANRDGFVVHVRDVARVEDGVAEPESVGFKQGKPTILLNLRKQSGTNTVEVVHTVKERVAKT